MKKIIILVIIVIGVIVLLLSKEEPKPEPVLGNIEEPKEVEEVKPRIRRPIRR